MTKAKYSMIATTVVTLLGSGGLGTYYGVPFIKSLVNRMDVIIYLLCDKDPVCVTKTWDKVISAKLALDARHGGSH